MTDPLPPSTLGYSFTLTLPGTVNALGYWSDGNLATEQIGVWASGSSELLSGVAASRWVSFKPPDISSFDGQR